MRSLADHTEYAHVAGAERASTCPSFSLVRRRGVRLEWISAFVLVAALLGLLCLHLAGDPSPIKRLGDVGDEGYWLHNARAGTLFGTLLPDALNQGLIGAPLFTAVEYASLHLLGASLLAARLPIVLSAWLTLLLLYVLLRRHYSYATAFSAVAVLGVTHEFLIYARWATPIMLEVFFLTAVVLLLDWSRQRPILAGVAGACFVLAILSKLSALYFSPALLLLVTGSLFVRREMTGRHLAYLGIGALAVGLSSLVLFWLPHAAQVHFFLETIGQANVGGEVSPGAVVHRIARFPKNEFFSYPALMWLILFALLWLHGRATDARRGGIWAVVRGMNFPEWAAAAWISGVCLAVAFSPNQADRRLVNLLVPLVVLASAVISRHWRRAGGDGERTWPCLFAALPVASLLTAFMVWLCWRDSLLLARVWLGHVGLGAWQIPLFVGLATASVTVVILWYVPGQQRRAVIVALGCYLLGTLTLDAIWYAGATYTLRDRSRALRSTLPPRTAFTGVWAHWLSLENRALPVWYFANDSMYGDMNAGFPTRSATRRVAVLECRSFDGVPAAQVFSPGGMRYLNRSDFPNRVFTDAGAIRLCPYPFTHIYRYEGELYVTGEVTTPAPTAR